MNNINSLRIALINGISGAWNTAGIGGRFFILLLSPIPFLLLLLLFVLKYGLKLLKLLFSEVGFYWHKYYESTENVISLVDEFIQKKLISSLVFLWTRLTDESVSWDKNRNQLSTKWGARIAENLLKQIYFIFGIALILITLSSFIYSGYNFVQGEPNNILYVIVFRLLLLAPLIHRYIRYRIEGKAFSWDVEKIEERKMQIWNSNLKYVLVFIFAITLLLIAKNFDVLPISNSQNIENVSIKNDSIKSSIDNSNDSLNWFK